ncbi:MAG: hypothetical protein WD157_01980 [Patescibacteria group bacterium]
MKFPLLTSLLRQLGRFLQHNEKLLLAILAMVIAVSGSLWYRQYFNLDNNGPVAGGTYVDGVVGTADELDAIAAKLTKSGLFKVDREGKIVNQLIDNWQVNADNTKYTFDLKKNISSQEIADQLNQNIELLGPAIVNDEGDGVITVALNAPNPNLPLLLTQPLFDFGAYKLSKLSDTTAIFTRSTREYALTPYINKIVVHLFPDEALLIDALNKKKIDGARLEGDHVPDGYKQFSYSTPNYFAVIINVNRSPFRDTLFRQKVVQGKTVARAQVTLTVSDEDQAKSYAPTVKKQWEKQGLVVTIQTKSADDIANNIGPTRDFEALLTGISYGPELDPYYLWHSSQIRPPGNNLSGIKNDAADKLIDQIESEYLIPERNKKILLLHQQLASLGVLQIIGQVTRNIIVDNNVVPAAPYIPLSVRDRWQAIDQWYLK